MKSTYKKEDVEILLDDLTGKIKELTNKEKNELIYTGKNPNTLLLKEYEMSETYLKLCKNLGKKYIKQTAIAVGKLAEQLYKYKSKNVVLVSIVRSGIPIGILVKRYLQNKYKKQFYHYAISIKAGIDKNAMNYILSKHKVEDIQFVDSWTGKGTVMNTIINSAKQFEGLDSSLAVLSDCLNITKYCGIREDIAIMQAPINACITGLVSMPVKQTNPEKFDGGIYLDYLEKFDISKEYVDLIENEFDYNCNANDYTENLEIHEEASKMVNIYNTDISKVNPGINEAARAILRRKVSVLLVKDREDIQVGEIIELANLKNIKIEEYNFKYYKAATIAEE